MKILTYPHVFFYVIPILAAAYGSAGKRPLKPVVTDINGRFLTVVYCKSGRGEVFQLQIREQGGTWEDHGEPFDGALNLTIGLKTNTKYSFRIVDHSGPLPLFGHPSDLINTGREDSEYWSRIGGTTTGNTKDFPWFLLLGSISCVLLCGFGICICCAYGTKCPCKAPRDPELANYLGPENEEEEQEGEEEEKEEGEEEEEEKEEGDGGEQEQGEEEVAVANSVAFPADSTVFAQSMSNRIIHRVLMTSQDKGHPEEVYLEEYQHVVSKTVMSQLFNRTVNRCYQVPNCTNSTLNPRMEGTSSFISGLLPWTVEPYSRPDTTLKRWSSCPPSTMRSIPPMGKHQKSFSETNIKY